MEDARLFKRKINTFSGRLIDLWDIVLEKKELQGKHFKPDVVCPAGLDYSGCYTPEAMAYVFCRDLVYNKNKNIDLEEVSLKEFKNWVKNYLLISPTLIGPDKEEQEVYYAYDVYKELKYKNKSKQL